jgi:hypothetical protein
MLVAHRDYKKQAVPLAKGLRDLKDRQLAGEAERALYELVEKLLDLDD